MPARKEVISTGETYHIFNRSINSMQIFNHKYFCKRMQKLLWFYHFRDPGIKYSRYEKFPAEERLNFYYSLVDQPPKIKILAYCLMPNHYHLLATQLTDGGISEFIKSLQSSFSQKYNHKTKRKGPVFLPQFKLVRIEDDNQLLHVQRYIHLNPLTGYLVKSIVDLDKYNWSSWGKYMNPTKKDTYEFVHPQPILEHFSSIQSYKQFVADQTDYQRSLKTHSYFFID